MRYTSMLALLALLILLVGCGHKRFHQGSMPDPGPYMIHFDELDADSNDAVNWEEFKQRFPDTNKHVFKAVDQDGDGIIDHDEWHDFKEAHTKK